MVFSEAEFAELKAKAFKVPERLDTGVDVGLFSETVVSALGVKFHGYPVVSCVMRWLFIVTTTYVFYIFYCCWRINQRVGEYMSHVTKKRYGYLEKKGDATFHLRVFHFVSDHAVFPVATNKMRDKKKRES